MDQKEQSEALAVARFRAMIEETFFPTPNSIDLVRTAQTDFNHRVGAAQPQIAELFQENTKLIPFATLQVPSNLSDFYEAQRWFFTTPYRMREGDIEPGQEQVVYHTPDTIHPGLAELLRPFSSANPLTEQLFAVDLFVLYGDQVLRQVPNYERLWIERRLHQQEQQFFRSALLNVSREVYQDTQVFLVLAGAAWRYMMFFGPRGYRRMLYDAGSVATSLQQRAQDLNLNPSICFDFYDTRVNQMLMLDGTERSALIIMPLQGVTL